MTSSAHASPQPIQWLLLTAMAVWGMNLSAVKALTASFGTLTLASVRMVVAVVALTALLALRRRVMPALGTGQLAAIIGCGALMVYANQLLFAAGLHRSSATHAALIFALNPMVSALLTSIAFGERVRFVRLAGIVLGFAGVAAVIVSRPGATLASGGMGDLLLVGSVVCFASGGVAVQRLSGALDPLALSWAIHVAGVLMLVLHTTMSSEEAAAQLAASDARAWALVIFSGVAATALAAVVWNRAIAKIGAARTAMALYWVPIFGVAFAVLFLGEPLTRWHFAGLVAVLTGSFLGSRRPPAVPSMA
jgi:drug/metabolite transporter (DMT)-like permease